MTATQTPTQNLFEMLATAVDTATEGQPEAPVSRALVIQPEADNPFQGSFPVYGPKATLTSYREKVVGPFDCLLRTGRVVLCEVNCFEQPQGTVEAAAQAIDAGGSVPLQRQVEMMVATPDAKIYVIDENGEPRLAPFHTNPGFGRIVNLPPQWHLRSPFIAVEDSEADDPACFEQVRRIVLDAGFEPVDFEQRNPDSRRHYRWALTAHRGRSNSYGTRLQSQIKHGVDLAELVISGPRPEDQRRKPAGSTHPAPEYESPFYSIMDNHHIARLRLANPKTADRAWRNTSSWTGIAGDYPQRATVSGLSVAVQVGPRKWQEVAVDFWADATSE